MLLYYMYETPASPGERSNRDGVWSMTDGAQRAVPVCDSQPWLASPGVSFIGLSDSRLSERSLKGLEHCQFQIVFTGDLTVLTYILQHT